LEIKLEIKKGGFKIKVNKNKFLCKMSIIVSLCMVLSLCFVGLAQAQEEIPLGILMSLTGEIGSEGQPIYQTFQWQTEEINKFGGPLGKPIKLYVADDETSVERAILGCKKLITINGVKGILGTFSDGLIAVMDFCKDNKVTIISQWAGSHRLSEIGGEYQFRTCPDDFYEGNAAVAFMLDQGWKKIALVVENSESTRSISDIIKQQMIKLGGEIVVEQVIEPGMTTYRAEVRKIKEAKPEVVFLGVYSTSLSVLFPQMYESGIDYAVVLSSDALQQSTMDVLGAEFLENVYGEKPAAESNSPAYKIFEERYKKNVEGQVGAFTPNGYDALNIWALAVQAAGTLDGEAIAQKIRYVANPPGIIVYSYEEGMAQLRLGNDINYQGASGPCDFNEFGDIMGNMRVVQIKNGEWVDVKFYSGEEITKLIGE
jgi:ABC-type branched-subunit amino acid transport system substrate-binding protein